MKFVVKSASSSGRLGIISNIARLPDFELETPHVFLYTTSGTIPHITPDVLQMISPQKSALNISIPSILNIKDRLKQFDSNIANFIGMKDHLTYCTFINPGEKYIGGYHEKDDITIWTKHGRKILTAESYMEFMEVSKPDLFLVLADGDTTSESSQKRIQKSLSNSITLLEKCLNFYNKSEALKESKIIGALQGGFNLQVRENFSKILGDSSVFGVVVDGLHDCSENVSEMSFNNIKPVVQASLKHVPKEKLRIIHGCWNPSVLLDLVELGIDMFDTSYPYIVSEKGTAFVFPNTEDILTDVVKVNGFHTNHNDDVGSSQNILKPKNEEMEPNLKKPKLDPNSKYYISMKNSSYVTDFSPILKTCNCYTCKNHTKAYIHHLLNVQELLGRTLLMIHNLHHYFLFFSTIRKTLRDGKFEEMKKSFRDWLDRIEEDPC